jgi:predicted alpha-1,6-mannanase (GH76 family)
VIFEKLGTNGWDPGMFKGVFARYLGQMRDTLIDTKRHPELAAKIDQVLRTSASSMLVFGLGPDGQFSISWEEGGKDQTRNYNTQASALALLTATLKPKP